MASQGLIYDFGRRSNGRQATGTNSFRDPQPTTNIGSSATDVRSHEQTCQWPPDSRSTAPKVLSLHGDKPLKGVKILVVDDNVVLLRLMTVTLARLGATVEPSKNGEEAFVLVRNSLQGLGHDHKKEKHSPEDVVEDSDEKKLYDLIFMDCEMPTMNGYEAARKIREEEKHYGDMHIPIIALTAHAMAEEITKSLQSGMDFHLVKPVAQHELFDAIQKVLRI